MRVEKFLDNFGRSESLWMYACARCGECVNVCPIFKETGDEYTAPGFKIKKMRGLITKKLLPFMGKTSVEILKKVVKGIYECALCGRCWSVCPYNYDLVSLWEKARESAFETGLCPEPLLLMVNALKTEKNIFKRPHLKRTEWIKGSDIPIKEKADTIYFVGCMLSYKGPLKSVAKATAAILTAAGENWTILKDEVCCGAPLRFSGGTKYMEDLMEANIKAIESTGASKIVFSCPGCYRTFWQDYSEILGSGIQMVHVTELIDGYIRSEKIKTEGMFPEKITYHDPCELARLSGVIREPRRVLEKLTVQLVELPENKFNVKCCGGGGLFKAVNTERSLEISKKRVQEAERIGATTLVTACPSCFENLTLAAYSKKTKVKVMDFAQVVAQQLK